MILLDCKWQSMCLEVEIESQQAAIRSFGLDYFDEPYYVMYCVNML
jgi:hypothetical protein